MKHIYECLNSLDTIIMVKSLDFQIKCFHKILRSISNYNSQLEIETNQNKQSLDYHRKMLQKLKGNKKVVSKTNKINKFSKLELIFTIKIFRVYI